MTPPTPPNELAVPPNKIIAEALDVPMTPPNSAPISRSTSYNTIFHAQPLVKKSLVNLIKPVEPPVTYLEILKFVVWSITVILMQLWSDVSSGKFYKPLLSTDFMTHYFASASATRACEQTFLTVSSTFPLAGVTLVLSHQALTTG